MDLGQAFKSVRFMIFPKRLLVFALVFMVSAGLSFKYFLFAKALRDAQVAQVNFERLNNPISTSVVFSEGLKKTKIEQVSVIHNIASPISEFTKSLKDTTHLVLSKLASQVKSNPKKTHPISEVKEEVSVASSSEEKTSSENTAESNDGFWFSKYGMGMIRYVIAALPKVISGKANFLDNSNVQLAQSSSVPIGESGLSQKTLRQSQPKPLVPPEFSNADIKIIEDSRDIIDPGDGPSFFVKKIELEGNTLFESEILAPIVDVGEGIDATLGILALYAQEVTAYYSARGFILTEAYIPNQKIENAVVKMIVKEGFIDEVEVTGNKYLDKESIKKRFFNVQAEEVMQESTLERALLELNDVRGVTARSTLKRGKISGSSDIVLEVEEGRPYYFGIDADNFGSEFTGQARFGTTAIVNSLWKFSDEVFFRAVKSDDDQNLITGYYQLPIDKFGRSTFKVGYTYSDQGLGASLIPLNAFGRTNILNFEVGHKLLRTRNYRLDLRSGFEYKKFRNFQLGNTSSSDNITDIYFGASGNFSDSFNGTNSINLKIQQGIGGTDASSAHPSRSNADATTTVATFDVTRFQNPGFWDSFLIMKLGGQLSSDRNLSPGLFAAGGFGTVRGFPLAQLSGDWGYTASAEYVVPVPLDYSIGIGDLTVKKVLSINGFIEHGRVFAINLESGERNDSITGVGGGAQLNVPLGKDLPTFNLAFNYGYPIGGPIPSDGSFGTVYVNGGVTY
jgi:hemolysin activation/secretion protein